MGVREGFHPQDIFGRAVEVHGIPSGLNHPIDRNEPFFTVQNRLFYNDDMGDIARDWVYDYRGRPAPRPVRAHDFRANRNFADHLFLRLKIVMQPARCASLLHRILRVSLL
jgi:hypothetical protein